MACMKCGRETAAGQVFCENCLEIMEYYPVKPGTTVQLPKRPLTPPRKLMKRRGPGLEEQVSILKQRVRILTISLVVVLLIVGLLAVPAYEYFFHDSFLPGQNYSTATSSTASTAGAAD